MEAPSLAASVKGANFDEQLEENEGPWNNLAIDLNEDQVDSASNFTDNSSLSSGIKSMFTVIFCSDLWASFTGFFRTECKKQKKGRHKPK